MGLGGEWRERQGEYLGTGTPTKKPYKPGRVLKYPDHFTEKMIEMYRGILNLLHICSASFDLDVEQSTDVMQMAVNDTISKTTRERKY